MGFFYIIFCFGECERFGGDCSKKWYNWICKNLKNIKLYVYFCIFVIFINSYYIMKIKFILIIDNLMIYIWSN